MIFLFSKQQSLTFGPTHTPIQCIQKAHSLVKLTTYPAVVPRLKMRRVICLYGVHRKNFTILCTASSFRPLYVGSPDTMWLLLRVNEQQCIKHDLNVFTH